MNDAYNILSLARKTGKIVAGEAKSEKLIKSGSALFAIIANDASDNTKKKFENMLKYRDIEYIFFGEKNKLGNSIGKDSISVIGVYDENVLNLLKTKLCGGDAYVQT